MWVTLHPTYRILPDSALFLLARQNLMKMTVAGESRRDNLTSLR